MLVLLSLSSVLVVLSTISSLPSSTPTLVSWGNYVSSYNSGINWSLFLGARYFFTENVGAFAELGYGISNLNLGVTFKF